MLEPALTTVLLWAQLTAHSVAPYHVEREALANGAELVTVFARQQRPGGETADVPLLSVLRDTLGDNDAETGRLRYVWVLTSTPPTPLKRIASSLSFAYFNAGTQQHADRVPKPILDLAAPSKIVWPNLFGDSVQALRLDPMGASVRSPTRSYRGNSNEYRELQVFQALSSLEGLAHESESQPVLSDAEMRQIYARLRLSNRTFGGLVQEENVERFYDKQAGQREQVRGHNWELLRQRAELCGLYFEPLGLADSAPSQALLWVARHDLGRRSQYFNRQFLNIANPWTDSRLLHWTGYSQMRYLDSDNRPVPPEAPGARAVEMIPLALYSLDYPRAPLLLADFRNGFEPKRREMVEHGADTMLTGVLGVARFGNWPFLAADTAWTFVRGRQGNAVNRSARLEAYSEARAFHSVDANMDPALRSELLHRIDHLALNPLENGTDREAVLAREQYAALSQYALSPTGLDAKLERDRRKELDSYTRSGTQRFLAALGRLFREGPRDDPERGPALRAQLASYRRSADAVRFLEQVLASSPRPDVAWDAAEIRHFIEAVSTEPHNGSRTTGLLAQIFSASDDSELRMACLRALRRLGTTEARNELARLQRESETEPHLAQGPVPEGGVQSGTE